MDKLGLNFGQVIAFIIPGFIGAYALAPYVPVFHTLLGGAERVPSTNSFVPLLFIALALGIIINAISELFVRPLIHSSGVKAQRGLVQRKVRNEDLPKYELIVEVTFRYHQFYSNMLVAILLFAPVWLVRPIQHNLLRNVSFPFIVTVLFLVARRSLKNFYNGLSTLD